jgi:quinol-cytochrome oxidoreductase complex cytochrome b subunit
MAIEQDEHEEETIPFYPDQVRREAIVAYVVLLAVILVGVLIPPHLGPKADPMETPVHIKPEWYFLALYQLIKLVPPDVGVLIPLVAVAGLILLPFLDRTGTTDGRQRRWRMVAVATLAIVVMAMTVWGYVS